MDANALRRAVAAAQAILRETKADLIIDGKPGSYTLGAYQNAPSSVKSAVDNVMAALGVAGSMPAANELYNSAIRSANRDPGTSTASQAVFDLQIVPAVTREARRRGLDPVSYITQLALETGYGKSIPAYNGKSTYNAAGIKAAAVGQKDGVTLRTKEYNGGMMETVNQKFAVFADAEDFAKAYFEYLFDGPSSYRYKGLKDARTPIEFGTVLQKGGYATDPEYARKFAATAATVARKYSLT